MTNSNPPPDRCASEADETACWQEAARIRREHPRWVVIWLAHESQYRARPLFRAPRGTVATAALPAELVAQMEAVETAARAPRDTSGQIRPPSQEPEGGSSA